ncbi:MAG: VanW family protein [Patescibacteria group bacterium]|nr:VanW family protein [Patescibacteria group bacterium]
MLTSPQRKIFTASLLGFFWWLTATGSASAQVHPRGFNYTLTGLTLTVQDKTFVVPPATVRDWQGQVILPNRSSIDYAAPDLAQSLLSASGLSTTTTPETPITYQYRLDKIYDFIASLAEQIDQPPVDAKLTITDNRVTDFAAPQNGQSLDVVASSLTIISALEQGRADAQLVVATTSPQITLADTNNLGIKELVAEGISNFKGSPNNRRHNIAVGIEKMKGVLVAPGAEFSFDDNLGPVDGQHGFLPELVIKKNDTVPEFGGGLCQVSTTTFRAAMDGGLPITARRNHAYAVSYYSPQGTDATIYPGVVDLKFINDTPGYLLIWPYEKDKNTLVFDFYGTKDSRQVTLEKPVQYDRKSDGSMKASWTRVVTKDGQTSTSTFKSVYQPPALFHKTEEFVATSTTAGLQMPKLN